MSHVLVSGVVAVRDKQPYIHISIEGAMDLLQMCARTEADAMIVRFFDGNKFPDAAAMALLMDFRDFRAGLDAEVVETSLQDPDGDGTGEP
jgi:hypothetical protein